MGNPEKLTHWAMLLVFVAGDLLTTAYGLSRGFLETTPYAYIFGASPTVVLLWLAGEKVVFLAGVCWLLSRCRKEYQKPLGYFSDGVLFAYGLAVTLQNLRYLS